MSTVMTMYRLRPYPALALVVVTLFIWLTRVPLAWSTTDGGFTRKLVPVIPVLLFVVPAALALGWALADGSLGARRPGLLVRVLAVWTVGYWAVRLPLILLHDHPVPFKVVHGVLAAVSVAASTAAWRSLRGSAVPVERTSTRSVSA